MIAKDGEAARTESDAPVSLYVCAVEVRVGVRAGRDGSGGYSFGKGVRGEVDRKEGSTGEVSVVVYYLHFVVVILQQRDIQNERCAELQRLGYLAEQ